MASTLCLFTKGQANHGSVSMDFNWCRTFLIWSLVLLCLGVSTNFAESDCGGLTCVHGQCQINNTTQSLSLTGQSVSQEPVCICEPGWTGGRCESCGGRIRLTESEGVISDGFGNYTVDTKCTWLIEGLPNTVIRLRFHQFATECSWDHLFIYDGNSVYAPLVAVLSGLVIPQDSTTEWMPEIVTHSGMVYLHFYSDAAYNMSGFKLKYKMGTCPLECSGRGTCTYIKGPEESVTDGVCTCNKGTAGNGCQFDSCPNNCTYGECKEKGDDMMCVCDGSRYNGEDCSIPETKGHWMYEHPSFLPEEQPSGRASHKSVVFNDEMWVVGGYTFDQESVQKVFRYSFVDAVWNEVEVLDDDYPAARYGHSLVVCDDDAEPLLLMFGGVVGNTISDELWAFDMNNGVWVLYNIGSIQRHEGPLAVVGHSAHYINGIMYIIFGHSPVYGYMNTVQECNMSSITKYLQCKIATTTGAIVKGGYGHTSVYDPDQGLIYIHAGYHSTSVSSYQLTNGLYSYSPTHRVWKILVASGQSRYLHSAVLMNGLMLVFGGNTHNDTSVSQGAKCYSLDFLAYDLACDTWTKLDSPHLQEAIARFGHSAEVYKGKMYIFGGFNGLLLSDMYSYTPASCEAFQNESECKSTREGIKCVWANERLCYTPEKAHLALSQKTIEDIRKSQCPDRNMDEDAVDKVCSGFDTCPSCVENSYDCTWCGSRCTSGSCSSGSASRKIVSWNQCRAKYSSNCPRLHNCQACGTEAYCTWVHSMDRECDYNEQGRNKDQSSLKLSTKSTPTEELQCTDPCHMQTTCENCTSAQCMWCSNQQRCVESNSYIASFPYGQCMEWTTMKSKCPATRCSGLRTCEECQENPSCGWCDDGSNTGLGTCIEGGQDGPIILDEDGQAVLTPDVCPAPRWFFIECPLCQCNGHSTCHPNTDQCIECEDLTTGPQCEYCMERYFGDATNGGNCTACECNDRAEFCDRESGKCHCYTKGLTGNSCDRCDEQRKYYGDPTSGGTCYYFLSTDFQFTFNLSQKDDKYYTQINFINIPTTSDKNADFKINYCSGHAFINITVKSKDEPEERLVMEHEPCTPMKKEFSHKDFKFGRDYNTTFSVYVYDFTTPFALQISFSQYPHIDLLQFFVTFFSCFLSLLLIAAVFWKLKQKYDMCMRRQMMAVEMEQRASRPFASCQVEVDDPSVVVALLQRKDQPEVQTWPATKRKKPSKPSPMSLEPLQNQKAAVLTMVVRLPCGDEDYTPPGQSGLSIGSALVTLGSTRKSSMDHSKDRVDRRKQAAVACTGPNCA